jgi:hypothetical protein
MTFILRIDSLAVTLVFKQSRVRYSLQVSRTLGPACLKPAGSNAVLPAASKAYARVRAISVSRRGEFYLFTFDEVSLLGLTSHRKGPPNPC